MWVRDHLIFEPHGEMEDPNRSFYDALITLTAIGAVTSKIELGTGSLIPFRHPLEVALSVATMTQLVGPRVILGYGAGTFDHEFEAIGIDPEIKRWHLVKSTALILRKVWQGERRRLQGRVLLLRGRHDRAQAGRRPGAVLVLRQHAGVGAARGRVLRGLDARADLARDLPRAGRQDGASSPRPRAARPRSRR